MKINALTITIASMIVIVLLIVAFFIGGFIGFNRGYSTATYYQSVDGYEYITQLECLQEGNLGAVFRLLETKLASAIQNTKIFKPYSGIGAFFFPIKLDFEKTLPSDLQKASDEYYANYPPSKDMRFSSDTVTVISPEPDESYLNKPKPIPVDQLKTFGNNVHVIKMGETLESISQQYYGSPDKGDLILKANPKIIDRNNLYVGMKIMVPQIKAETIVE